MANFEESRMENDFENTYEDFTAEFDNLVHVQQILKSLPSGHCPKHSSPSSVVVVSS